MKKIKLLGLLLAVVFVLSSIVACKTVDNNEEEVPQVEITISALDGNLNVAVGGTKQLKVEVENGKSSDVQYSIVSGLAMVNANGLVTINTDAEVGSKIDVTAKIGDVSSNTLQLTIVDLTATKITLTPSATVISKASSVTFTATFEPSYATITDYTLSIDGNNDFAEIDNTTKTLTIKSSATPAQINGKQIAVKATLNANASVFTYVFINVVEEDAVSFLSCENVNFVVNKDANKSIVTEAFSWDGDEMIVSASNYVYSGYDENVITVDANGKITPKGHGSTTVTVSYGAITTDCVVNIMIAPESIAFNSLNDHMKNVGEFYYSKNDANGLNLNVNCQTKTGYNVSSENVTYKFEDLDNAQSSNIATVTNNVINFNKTGRIKITVTSNSSVGDYEVNEAYEVKKSIIVNVNDGVNVYSIADLKEYANDENVNKTANILANLNVTDSENFGNENNLYIGLTIYGNRIIQGNGYVFSVENLSRGVSLDTDLYGLLHFKPLGNAKFSVAIYDWTLLGNVNIEGKHKDGTSIVSGTDITNNFYRAIEISGADLIEYNAGNKSAILESAIVKNVTIKGFYTGVRFEHAISARLENFLVGDCFANGIENAQSHLTVKNIEIQQVGAFGIEITPDDVVNQNTANPSGSAGRQYNETATVRYEGYLRSSNWNNGASTVYMKNLGESIGISIGELVQLSTSGLIKNLTSDQAVQQKLMQLAYATILDAQGRINFSTLVFVNPYDFQQYIDKGNTENAFCEFETTEKINVKKLFENCMANPNYDYTEKKFLILDLADLDLGLGAKINAGQIILMNNAYVE